MKNRKWIKWAILISVVFIIIIALIIVLINKKEEKDEEQNTEMTQEEYQEFYKEMDAVQGEFTREEYFAIQTAIETFLNSSNKENSAYYGYDDNGNYILMVGEETIAQSLYDVLSKEFIEKNKITLKNTFDYVKEINQENLLSILEVDRLNDGDVSSFAVHSIVQSMDDYSILQNLYTIVNIDNVNSTFSIEPKYDVKNISELTLGQTIDSIEENENNFIENQMITEENMILEYMNLYKRVSIVYPEYIYNKLDEEYRNKRFESLDKFKEFVTQNKENIETINLEKYRATEESDYNQFVGIDANENYYIFREKGTLDFTIILDTYTIDLPEFLEKYNSSSEETKAGMNVEKIASALKQKDYSYVYSKLSSGFKNNYFKTEQDFINYANSEFGNKTDISYHDFETNNSLYTCKITFAEKGNEENSTEKTFIIQLGEGTNYEVAFGMDNQ